MQTSVSVGISLPQDIILSIDAQRGDIPRSRWVLRLLEKAYTGQRQEQQRNTKIEKSSPERLIGTQQSGEHRSL
jgi:hypothetical protein